MLLARLLSKIYKKNGIILIDSRGQKYICGKPDLKKPLTLTLLKKDLNWKLLINPDLNFPEAYMRGDIEIENGSLFDFLSILVNYYKFYKVIQIIIRWYKIEDIICIDVIISKNYKL